MKRRTFLKTSLALTTQLPLICNTELKASAAKQAASLDRLFANPSRAARPHTWWHWMNGNVTKEGITADLEAMANVGIGGAQIFNVDQGVPKGDAPFFSPQWREAFTHAVKEAKRVGLELCLHNCAGWSSSGGPWITPEYSMRRLTWTETLVKGGQTSAKLQEPHKNYDYYVDVAVLAIRQPKDKGVFRIPDYGSKSAVDRGGSGLPLGDRWVPGDGKAPQDSVVSKSDIHVFPKYDGEFKATLPEGDWILLRMGATTTGAVCSPAPDAGRGLECDKLSKKAMDLHWEKGVAPLLKDLGDLAGTVLNNALIDSYEVGSQNYSEELFAEFEKHHGYSPLPFLPVVAGFVVDSAEFSERFLWDWRRTIADLFAENYAGRFAEHCHANGMLCSIEPYGNGPFDNLQVGTKADIAMGEFWIGGAAIETIKIAASAVHTKGNKIVGAESFTADDHSGRWQVEPYGIKALGDRIFTQGVNRYIFHRYAHQPWIGLNPGMTMGPWGTHFERTVTWWEQSKEWLKYIARCQTLLQHGTFVADVLTFCGDDAPNDLNRPSLPFGFDYDGCDRTTLMTLQVVKGDLVLPGGMSYRALILPDSKWMTPKTLKKLVELSKAGATIVGSAPEKSPSLANYPSCDEEIRRISADLKLVPFAKLAQALKTPDVAFSEERELPWIHRREKDADFYFVSNPRKQNLIVEGIFRVAGKTPELWSPETGLIEDAPEWNPEGGGVKVTLRLGPSESVFVVFRKNKPSNHLVAIEATSGISKGAKKPVLTVLEAYYEPVEGAGGIDVTAKVKRLLAAGEGEIPATNAVFGDPTRNRIKRLRIVYQLDGKQLTKTAPENGVIVLEGNGGDAQVPAFMVQNGKLVSFDVGQYRLKFASGAVKTVRAPLMKTVEVSGPWRLTFPANLGAPSEVTLARLASWTDHSDVGVKYFSGSATYENRIRVAKEHLKPGNVIFLDLGQVKNFAEITLNGVRLPTLWKAPWRADVTKLLKPGANSLSIRVTNLWVNRLIGDEQFPDEVEWTGKTGPIKTIPEWVKQGKPRPKTERVAFSTWRFWNKEDAPLESGLLGPVRLMVVPTLEVSE